MIKNKRLALGILVIASVSLIFSNSYLKNTANAATGTPSVSGYDLVDSGKHMDYLADTKYDGYLDEGASLWNNYLGNTVIREDKFNTILDCDIYDVSNKKVTWCGRTLTPKNGVITGCIQLNTYYMDQYIGVRQLLVIKHEFGHALGCDENDCSKSNIMYPELVYTNTNLTIHDKASVNLAKKSW